jgi:hypothetical protein
MLRGDRKGKGETRNRRNMERKRIKGEENKGQTKRRD